MMIQRLILTLSILTLVAASTSAQPAESKLDRLVQQRAERLLGGSAVIVHLAESATLTQVSWAVQLLGGVVTRQLPILNALAAHIPNVALKILAAQPIVARVSLDRVVAAANERTAATVGAAAIRQQLGLDGAGVGIAIIDSGVTRWHDDLATLSGGQRVTRFVDLVGGRTTAYDDHGHGTHVAGIIGGNGYDSNGARAGIAPAAHLLVVKAIDARGVGRISDVIGAIDYVVRHRHTFSIRVVNLSLSAGLFESYNTDPLTVAAKRAVDAGLVVVAAAGNAGRDRHGRTQYGAISAPGNAPWVLTVGASSHMGSVDRTDDTAARFSSRGPSAVDYAAKPDLLAPGVGIESLSNPSSALYRSHSAYLLPGTRPTSYLPYLSLSGTSMSAPVVAGTVALMLQANPTLTPNQVKAILQYTSEISPAHDPLTQGAGFLNARGAVDLARFFADPSGPYPAPDDWSRRVIWGNQMVSGGRLTPAGTAWARDVTWGARSTPRGEDVTWGVLCATAVCPTPDDWVAWGGQCLDLACSTVIWGNGESRNVVWGRRCGSDDCGSAAAGADGTVVWGSAGDETVVWGSDGDETVVWGSTYDETVVWGSSCSDSSCEPVIWGSDD